MAMLRCRRRLTTTLLVMYMIIFDHVGVSDSLLADRHRRRSDDAPSSHSSLSYQLGRHSGVHERLGQEDGSRVKVNALGQGRREGGEVKYEDGSRSDNRRQLEYYVSLDTRGDFELFWDVDSVTEMIQFQLVARVDKDDLLAFGFSAYGEPQDADFCVMWTDLHGRHFFQVYDRQRPVYHAPFYDRARDSCPQTSTFPPMRHE